MRTPTADEIISQLKENAKNLDSAAAQALANNDLLNALKYNDLASLNWKNYALTLKDDVLKRPSTKHAHKDMIISEMNTAWFQAALALHRIAMLNPVPENVDFALKKIDSCIYFSTRSRNHDRTTTLIGMKRQLEDIAPDSECTLVYSHDPYNALTGVRIHGFFRRPPAVTTPPTALDCDAQEEAPQNELW